MFYNWEGLRSVLGKAPAWNLRLLPFWYLMLFLLAGLGVAELVRLTALGAAWVVRGPDASPRPRPSRTPAADERPLAADDTLARATRSRTLIPSPNRRGAGRGCRATRSG